MFLLAGLLAACSRTAASPTPTDTPGTSPYRSAPPSPTTAAPSPSFRTYVIASGDTFAEIAARFGLTVEELQAANPAIDDVDVIAVGQIISIPASSIGTVIRIEGPDYRHPRLGELPTLRLVGNPQLVNEGIRWEIAMADLDPLPWSPYESGVFDESGQASILADWPNRRAAWRAYRAWVPASATHPVLWTQTVVVEWGGKGSCPAEAVDYLPKPVLAPDGTTYELVPSMDDEYNSQWLVVADNLRGVTGTGWRHRLEPCWEPDWPGVVAGSDATAYATWSYRVGGKWTDDAPAELVVVGPEGVRSKAQSPGSIEQAPDGTVFATRMEVNYEVSHEPTFRSMTIAALGPDGFPRAGWPFTTTDPSSWPVFGADFTVYLAQTTDSADRIIALGPDGQVKPGWPYAVPGELEWTVCGAGCANVPESPGVAPDGSVVFYLDAGIYLIRPDGGVKDGWPYLLPKGTSIPMPAPVDTPAAGAFRAVIGSDGRIYMPRADGRYSTPHDDMMCLLLDGTLCPGWPVRLPHEVQGYRLDESGTLQVELNAGDGSWPVITILPDGTIVEDGGGCDVDPDYQYQPGDVPC